MSKRKQQQKQKYDILTIFFCIIFGCIWAFLGYSLYQWLYGVLWTPALVGLYFGGLALMQILAIMFSCLCRGYQIKQMNTGKAFFLVLVIMGAALVLDFIYELRFSAASIDPTSYIFVIDDSDSNNWNDEENKRGDAYLQVLETCKPDFPFAVYKFDQDAHLLISMRPASQAESISDKLSNWGGTDIIPSLNTVLDDLKNGAHPDAGSHPRIILISDGESSEFGITISTIHRKCKEQNVSISTIGYGEIGGRFLAQIAEGANGISITIDNLDKMAGAMKNAATAVTEARHNLLNFRDNVKLDLLYAVERVLFVLILGFLFLLIKAELTQTNVGASNTLVIQMVLVFISGVSLEFGINTIRIPMFYALLIVSILFLITFSIRGKKNAVAPSSVNNQWESTTTYSVSSDSLFDY